jgi:type II secretory pathway component PulF
MQLKTFITISSIVSGAMLATLFVLQAIMPGVAEQWVNQGADLNLAEKILIGVAAFWSKFWWLAWPFVIGAVFSFVGLIAILQRTFATRVSR